MPKYYYIGGSPNPYPIGGFANSLYKRHEDTPGKWINPETNIHPANPTEPKPSC